MALALGMAAALQIAGIAHAQFGPGFCTTPMRPNCIDTLNSNYSDEFDFNYCKRELEQYKAELLDWARCVDDAAVKEWNDVVRQYNCKVRGEVVCF